MLKKVKGAFGFLTILPVGMPDSLEEVAEIMYIFPLIGVVIGLLGGLVFWLFNLYLPLSISAVIGFFTLLFLTGLHHLDGLLDFSDAVVFRGSVKERIAVIHDANAGTGGFAAGVFIILLGILATYEYLLSGGSPVSFFIIAEALAKLAMVFTAALGTPAFEGTGSVFVKKVRKERHQTALALLITSAVVYIMLGSKGFLLLLFTLLSSMSLIFLSKKMIGGVSGDVFGAVNETTRTIVMVVMVWML